MKTLFTFLFLGLAVSLLQGAPQKNVPVNITQPDGTSISCFVSGDEYYNYLHDKQGYTIVQDSDTGWFVYAEKKGMSLSPTSLKAGQDNPELLSITPYLLPDSSILQQRFERLRSSSRISYGRSSTTGTINNICIFVRFHDQPEFTDAVSTYNDMFNSTNMVSVKGYFQEESNNQLNINTTFYPNALGGIVVSYRDSNPRSYYQPYNAVTNPGGYPAGPPTDPMMYGAIRLHTMLINAVNYIAPLIPPELNIDSNSDGSIDNLGFVCYGPPDGWADLLWPHYWVLDAYYPTVPYAYINGIKADDYNFELHQGIDAAVICHEFSHTMGFPDLYHYPFDGLNPCGYWDLMDTCFGTPQHHLTYMKWKYGGWFAVPPQLPTNGMATLNAVANNPFDCFIYLLPTGEQIWIEYRKQIGLYETRVPGSGLLIYRVDYSINGNDSGPPDEVYVYRPYVDTFNPDGNISWAHYAWEQSHTAINQYTDPCPFSQSAVYTANLNLYGIGTNTSTQISFEIGTIIPNIWKGTTDNNWFNNTNWTTGLAPTATDFVIIQQGVNTCNIPLMVIPPNNIVPAVCQYLRIENQLNVALGAKLQVSGSLWSNGRIYMDGSQLQVMGHFTIKEFYQTPWFICTNNPAAQIIIGGNCYFENNTNVQLTQGSLIFSNIGVSPPVNTFTMDAIGTVLNNLIINKTGSAMDYDSNNVFPIPLRIMGSLTLNPNTTFSINSLQDIQLDGNLTVNATSILQMNMGKLILTGIAGPQLLSIANPSSYLNDIILNNNTGVNTNLTNNLTIKGDLSLNSGTLAANTHTIFLKGNWLNNVGLGAFQKGTSRVVFNGFQKQTIKITSATGALMEDFYILELANAGDSLSLSTTSQSVQCDIYDWTNGTLCVTEGMFTAQLMFDNCLAGNYVCKNSGVMNLYDLNGNADIAGNIVINGGNINVHSGNPGPAGYSTWGLYNGSLTMDNGLFQFVNTGIHILPLGGLFYLNISGGQISAAGDFISQHAEFHPSGGLVTVTSSNPVNIETTGSGSFFDLELQADHVSTSNDVIINNALNVNSTCTFDVWHNASINMLFVDGTMNLHGMSQTGINNGNINGTLNLSSGAVLIISGALDNNGTINSHGQQDISVQIKGNARGYWKMPVNGFLSAKYTDFQNLMQEGIWVMESAVIDSTADFDNCIFRNGQNNCTYLTIDNQQNLNIDGISFPTHYDEAYNIAKTSSTGTITITNSSGSFSGPLFEDDVYNLINWIGYYPNLIITSLSLTDPNPYLLDYISYSVTIFNDSDYSASDSFRVHLFTNSSSAPDWNDAGDFYLVVDSLAAQDSVVVSFDNVYSANVENWTSWALIDPESAITESDEHDNIDSTPVTWNALPAIPTISISNTGSNTGRISWTYPIWADEYEVTYDSNPYGSFSNNLGSTANNYQDVSFSTAQMFYQVVAKRNNPR